MINNKQTAGESNAQQLARFLNETLHFTPERVNDCLVILRNSLPNVMWGTPDLANMIENDLSPERKKAEDTANLVAAIAKLAWAKARMEDDFESAVLAYNHELLRFLYIDINQVNDLLSNSRAPGAESGEKAGNEMEAEKVVATPWTDISTPIQTAVKGALPVASTITTEARDALRVLVRDKSIRK